MTETPSRPEALEFVQITLTYQIVGDAELYNCDVTVRRSSPLVAEFTFKGVGDAFDTKWSIPRDKISDALTKGASDAVASGDIFIFRRAADLHFSLTGVDEESGEYESEVTFLFAQMQEFERFASRIPNELPANALDDVLRGWGLM